MRGWLLYSQQKFPRTPSRKKVFYTERPKEQKDGSFFQVDVFPGKSSKMSLVRN